MPCRSYSILQYRPKSIKYLQQVRGIGVLIGEPGINNPLRQRLTVKYFFQGLKPEELKDYCLSRLKLAGLNEDIFTPAALDAIYAITHGLPRLVNNLVTTCMVCACAKKQRTIDEEIVYQAQKELKI